MESAAVPRRSCALSPPLFEPIVLDLGGLLTSWGFYATLAGAYLVYRWSGDDGGHDAPDGHGDAGGDGGCGGE